MDTTVQKCSGEVKQTPDCPLNRTLKNNLQPCGSRLRIGNVGRGFRSLLTIAVTQIRLPDKRVLTFSNGRYLSEYCYPYRRQAQCAYMLPI